MCAGQSSVLSPLMSSVWLIRRSGWLCKAREISGALVGITDCFKLNFSLIGMIFFLAENQTKIKKQPCIDQTENVCASLFTGDVKTFI